MIKISIIIPVYNSEKYIDKCITSIKNQSFKDFEVLIINDGSIDKSKNIIETYLNDERFKLYNRENHGIGSSRNFGIEKSKGKYICFIDSDDYIDTNYLEKLYNKISSDKLDVVVCNYIEENEETKKETKIEIKQYNNTTIKDNPELLLTINKAPWNKIYKKSIIKNIRFPEDLKYEDTEFLCKVLLNAKIGYIDEYLNHYVIHSNSETTTIDKRCFDMFKILDNIKEYYKDSDKKINEYIDKMILQILTMLTIWQKYQKDKSLANEFIDNVFIYFEKNIPNYKNNDYFKSLNKVKAIIKKNKTLTKIYCDISRKCKIL